MKMFLLSYTMPDGSDWAFEIAAESFEDARARLLAIRQTGRLDGELAERFPAWQLPIRPWWARLQTWIKTP